MEYSKYQLEEIKHRLLDVLVAFQVLCKNNGLTYYACGGTCLGAIRHQGFIPWDDDIDVIMPRRDYEKLLSLHKEINDAGYELIDRTNNNLYLAFAKFGEKKSTIIELQRNPVVMGISIDIFPLDEASDTDESRLLFNSTHTVVSECVSTYSQYFFFDILDAFKALKIRYILGILFDIFLRRIKRRKCWKKFLENEEKISRQKGNFLIVNWGGYGFKKELHKKEWYGSGKLVQFESIQINVPENYDKYLSSLFGNYMELPPIEKRVSHHDVYFFDFEKRWTISEVRKMKLGKQILKQYKYE